MKNYLHSSSNTSNTSKVPEPDESTMALYKNVIKAIDNLHNNLSPDNSAVIMEAIILYAKSLSYTMR